VKRPQAGGVNLSEKPFTRGVAMSGVRRLFTTPLVTDLQGARLVRAILTGVGVTTFLFGTFGLQYLGPTRVEMILALLLLGVFAMTCAILGQAVVIAELLEGRTDLTPAAARAG
jgi:hypothetical protein